MLRYVRRESQRENEGKSHLRIDSPSFFVFQFRKFILSVSLFHCFLLYGIFGKLKKMSKLICVVTAIMKAERLKLQCM